MSRVNNYALLASLVENPAYRALQEEWVKKVSKIEENRDRAAARGSESAWRYYAGIEKGFKQAMLTLESELAFLEKDGREDQPPIEIEQLLSEARGETR